MVEFAERFPERFHDVAIAEQHAVTFAAGLACDGMKPVVAIYSTFLQRAYDQLIHDVAIQNLDVTFGIDRAGLVGGAVTIDVKLLIGLGGNQNSIRQALVKRVDQLLIDVGSVPAPYPGRRLLGQLLMIRVV